jgi:L-lactate dehydrogenase
MKISIIGGGGLVGSCTAFALQGGGVVREIALLDANAELAAGQALDLLHGSALMADQTIHAGGYEQIPTSDLICITAGLRRKPDESRLDLINRNVDLFLGILDEIAKAGYNEDAVVLVVSNPVDVLTYLAAKRLSLPAAQIIGLGTQLDTLRFRSLIAAKLNAPPRQVSALILGEHGDSMVPIWSSATIAGLPLERFPGWSINLQNELFTRTKGSGAEVIKKKGGAGFAVGVAIQEVIEAVALDRRAVLPVSTVQNGCYGLRDVAISVPTVVGRGGAVDTHEIEIWPKEVQSLRQSGRVLRETIDTVLKRVGKDLCACQSNGAKTPCSCKH